MTGPIRRIALTGGIATGKTHVRRCLEALGVATIDADQEARRAVAPGSPGLQAVRQRFGDAIVAADGSLDRKALAAIVFDDADARRDLEAIVHPRVRQAIDDWFTAQAAAGGPIGVADIPLLFETGRAKAFDGVIVAACAPGIQRTRLMARDGLSGAEADRRLAAQWPIQQKVALADWVVRTDGSPAETDANVRRIWDAVLARFGTRAGCDQR